MLQVGDILITRNTDEVGNPHPGYWNHTAILALGNWVVEAQEEPQKVIVVPLANFWKRYPEILVLRANEDHIARKMGFESINLVGKPYERQSSLHHHRAIGYNCVSVVRQCYINASTIDPKWVLPDNVATSLLLHEIEHKNDYEGWIKPNDWYEGMLDKFPI